MSVTLLYIMLFTSLAGILLVLVSKMSFVDDFLKKHHELKRSSHLHKEVERNDQEQEQHITHDAGVAKIVDSASTNNPISQIKTWLDRKTEERRRGKLDRVQKRRAKQLEEFKKDKVLESKPEDFKEEEKGLDADLGKMMQAKTVQPLNNKKTKADIRKEETKLINGIAKNPQSATHYRKLGQFYLKYGKLADAKECYKHVIKIDPKDEDAQEHLEKLSSV